MSIFLHHKYKNLVPYTPGEQPQNRVFTKLNTNENPYPPSPAVLAAVQAEVPRLNLYPDNTATALRRCFSQVYGIDTNQVFIANGSDEILAFCFEALCPNGAAFADITYGFYPVYSQFYGVPATVIPLAEDFSLRVEDYRALNRTLFIANPNAPTGLALSLGQLEEIVQTNPKSLVVIDEAYVDFGAESSLPLLQSYDNLLIVGTFSKSRSLAGGRLGYALGAKEVISDLELVKYSFNPYNVNRLTLAAATAALEDEEYFRSCTRKIISTREKALEKLARMGFNCTNSLSNFLFATHPGIPAETLHQKLREAGVLVRWWKMPRIENHLRISIGTDAQMDILYSALETILSEVDL